MTITAKQKTQFAAYFNDASMAVFSSTEIDDIWEEAEGIAESTDGTVIMVEARIIGVDRIMLDASKQVTYKQNSHSVNLSDMFKALEKMRGFLMADRERLEAKAAGTAVRMGKPVRVPSRNKAGPIS